MKVYAVYNIKGGVGKTASAVNLAWLCAKGGERTLLWDLDPQGAASFTFRIKPGVTGGGKRLVKDEDAVLSSIKGTDYDRLDVLPADFSYRNLDIVLDHEKKRVRKLARVLEPLAEEYDAVFIDCSPGISLVSENVFAAADVLLVPTIPTVLSLRTLGRLLKHLKTAKRRPDHVLPFFAMVDRRKGLHKKVCAWARDNSRGILERTIPYASLVEQMGVRRKPVVDFAPGSGPGKAYTALWEEIRERLEQHRTTRVPSRRTVRSLLRDLQPSEATRRAAPQEADSDITGLELEPEGVEEAGGGGVTGAEAVAEADTVAEAEAETEAETEAATAAGPDGGSGSSRDRPVLAGPSRDDATELEFKLRVADLRDFASLGRALPALGDVLAVAPVEQVNHFFDTSDWVLRRHGCTLRLREEDGAHVITAKGPAEDVGDEALTRRPEEEVAVDAARARQILAGRLSPLDALLARHGGRHTTLTAALARTLGDRPLFHVGTFRNERRRVGPVQLPAEDGGPIEVVFELDRTEFPAGRVDHEIEVEVRDADATLCREALGALLRRAGIPWRTAPSKAARFFGTLARETA